MLIDRQVRAKARATQESLEKVGRYAGGFSAACGMSTATYPGLSALTGATGLISVLAFWAADSKKRIANDPARDDYRSRTWVGESKIRPEFLLEDLPPDESRAPYTLVRLGLVLASSAQAESAMLRAFERAAGAFRDGDVLSAKARLGEQSRYAERASAGLTQAEGLSYQAAAQLEESEQERRIPDEAMRVSGTLDRLLPDEVLAALYRAGISINQLRRHSVRATSGVVMAAALHESAAGMGEFAAALQTWDAASDARKLERPRRSGRFVIYSADRMYGWRLFDPDNQLVADSQPIFATRDVARKSIGEVIEYAKDAEIVEE